MSTESSGFEKASCRNHDPNLWFPEKVGNNNSASRQERIARGICRGCQVQIECLELAIQFVKEFPDIQLHGIWASKSGNEITEIVRRSRKKV